MTDAPDDAPDTSGADPASPAPPLPGVGGDGDAAPSFDEPWQARAFGVAVALADGPAGGPAGAERGSESGDGTDADATADGAPGYAWSAFQSRLIAAVGDDAPNPVSRGDPTAADDAYYRQWLAALERLLDDRGLVGREEVAERAAEFAAGDRDASEFVAGDR
ncbi:MAG: hypothetical protein ABEH40_06800 [Haloferacaceae archaeon]